MSKKRDPQGEKIVQLTCYMEESAVKKIDTLAKKLGRSRSQFVRNLVLVGLEDASVLNALGVLRLAKVISDGVELPVPFVQLES